MSDKLACAPLSIVRLFGPIILAIFASSCGHTQASPPEVPIETVIQAIHDYGRGHQIVPPPPPSWIPGETEAEYQANITELLVAEDFAQLEKIAQQNRVEKGLFPGGVWKINVFYNAMGYPPRDGETKDSDYKLQIPRIEKWIAAYPQSAAARISLARLYTNYAGFVRGTGAADTVSNSQWKLYYQRAALAKDALLAAGRLKERDPHWYEAMQHVAFEEGWDKVHARELLDQALAFEPSYYHYYREHADYLQPQWYGASGEIQSFAEEVSSHLPEPDSSILYFRVISSLACNCAPEVADLPGTSWPKIKIGYANVQRLYGNSNLNANRFAFMAFTVKDKSAAQEAFGSVVNMEHEVWWSTRTFEAARAWADAP
jgi:hypothetical protein